MPGLEFFGMRIRKDWPISSYERFEKEIPWTQDIKRTLRKELLLCRREGELTSPSVRRYIFGVVKKGDLTSRGIGNHESKLVDTGPLEPQAIGNPSLLYSGSQLRCP